VEKSTNILWQPISVQPSGLFRVIQTSKGIYQGSLTSLADITLLPANLPAPQGTGNVVYFRTSRWSRFGSQFLPLFRTRRFMQRCSSFSFMRFTQIIHDRGLYALVRVLVTCAASSSNSTVASRCRGHIAGYARNRPS